MDTHAHIDHMLTRETSAEALVNLSNRIWWTVPHEQVEAFRLRLLRHRFDQLRGGVVTLDKLAALQNVDEIRELDDAVPLLFQHTAYKSYPMGLLEKGRFQQLTQWLDKLTTHDLSGVDARGCRSIDEWLQLLDDATPLAVNHSTGTTGKLSIIPRDKVEANRFATSSIKNFQGFGDEPDRVAGLLGGTQKIPVIYPSYRGGRHGGNRLFRALVERICAPGQDYALYEEALSADVSSLAGRVRTAEAKGELDRLEIPRELLLKYKASISLREKRQEQEAEFFARVLQGCAGRKVYIAGTIPVLVAWMQMAEERGLQGVFAPDSLITTGGGAKGLTLPEDWRPRVEAFLGARINVNFGMSESITHLTGCRHGHYHVPPYQVPFVLDPETGHALPRQGTQTGRYAFYDLLSESYWGGFLTGDEVTMSWGGCPCGREGPYLHPDVRRFSDKSADGDDKITCAGASDAHERAMQYLNEMAQDI